MVDFNTDELNKFNEFEEQSGTGPKKSYKIAVIGDKESVIGFRAVGFSVFIAEDISEAEKIIYSVSEPDSGFAIVFLVENYALKLSHVISKYASEPVPAIISVPGKNGSAGFGMAQVKKAVERAVGADILFKNYEI